MTAVPVAFVLAILLATLAETIAGVYLLTHAHHIMGVLLLVSASLTPWQKVGEIATRRRWPAPREIDQEALRRGLPVERHADVVQRNAFGEREG